MKIKSFVFCFSQYEWRVNLEEKSNRVKSKPPSLKMNKECYSTCDYHCRAIEGTLSSRVENKMSARRRKRSISLRLKSFALKDIKNCYFVCLQTKMTSFHIWRNLLSIGWQNKVGGVKTIPPYLIGQSTIDVTLVNQSRVNMLTRSMDSL